MVWGLAAVALWLAATPYQGIIQDARLYALMALHRLQPRAYAAEEFSLSRFAGRQFEQTADLVAQVAELFKGRSSPDLGSIDSHYSHSLVAPC